MIGAYAGSAQCERCDYRSFSRSDADVQATTLAGGIGLSLFGHVSSAYFGVDGRIISIRDSGDEFTADIIDAGLTASAYAVLGIRIR